MTRFAVVAVWLLATPVLGESEAPPAPDTPSLEGTQWRWERTSMGDGSVHEPPSDGALRYTVEFGEEGRLSIRADCNRVLGTWALEEGRLRLDAGPTTLVQCPEGSRSDLFLANLGAVALHFFRDGDLYLDLKYDSGTMKLVALSTELAGTRWRVTGYNNGKQAVVSVLAGTEITVSFEHGERVAGQAGCNRYQAPYEADGDALSVGPPTVTRMHCGEPEGVMQQERLFLVALQRAASRRFDGDRLELRTANGALAVSLVAVEPDEPDP